MAHLDHRRELSRARGPLFLSESHRNLAQPISIWTWSKVVEGLAERSGVHYGSPRVGRHGKQFRLLRFRTVDISKPAHLSMQERLTRVGRFIRNYSLDDLPNVFNVLKGKLSLVGPRPTEPKRVDLTDPAWQKVLTVRPGYVRWAILELASVCNTSPWPLKLQLEEEYRASFCIKAGVLRKEKHSALSPPGERAAARRKILRVRHGSGI